MKKLKCYEYGPCKTIDHTENASHEQTLQLIYHCDLFDLGGDGGDVAHGAADEEEHDHERFVAQQLLDARKVSATKV